MAGLTRCDRLSAVLCPRRVEPGRPQAKDRAGRQRAPAACAAAVWDAGRGPDQVQEDREGPAADPRGARTMTSARRRRRKEGTLNADGRCSNPRVTPAAERGGAVARAVAILPRHAQLRRPPARRQRQRQRRDTRVAASRPHAPPRAQGALDVGVRSRRPWQRDRSKRRGGRHAQSLGLCRRAALVGCRRGRGDDLRHLRCARWIRRVRHG